jgi:hypothetical protein
MDGKIKQHVCIKFCVKLGKFAAETLECCFEADIAERLYEGSSCFLTVITILTELPCLIELHTRLEFFSDTSQLSRAVRKS